MSFVRIVARSTRSSFHLLLCSSLHSSSGSHPVPPSLAGVPRSLRSLVTAEPRPSPHSARLRSPPVTPRLRLPSLIPARVNGRRAATHSTTSGLSALRSHGPSPGLRRNRATRGGSFFVPLHFRLSRSPSPRSVPVSALRYATPLPGHLPRRSETGPLRGVMSGE